MKSSRLFLLLIFSLLFTGCYNRVSVEKLFVIVGIGFDVGKDNKEIENVAEYLVFRGQREIDRGVSLEIGKTINEANSNRQLNLKKNYLLGTIRAYVIGEERAKLGIKDIIDTCVRDQERNLNTIMVVSKGSSKNIFEQVPKEESTMADEVKELIEASYSANFFTNNAGVKDVVNMYYQEGRNIVMPAIEKKDSTIKIAGLAVFDRDKLKKLIPIEEAIYVNMLRNNDVKGNIALVMDGYEKAVDVECITKRKVYVDREDGKLKYIIKLNVQGEIKLNTYNFEEENDEQKIIDDVKTQLVNNLNENLNKIVERAKNDYEIDVFDIQRYAVAKYGRENEERIRESFKDSEIEVVVDAKIRSTGRYK
ncbi:Ger(x)C family spore germination protein [Caloramator proteoclasticus]|uniref:Germination protein, Ger(X)C family n=1 Tax=Caloramator proteoclasticus DSM 10124 TaxID=1121262 RepID=A0A1M4ZKG3_9CLOT|nr:Ger(x)C family spore germination protein [Caloramator proteoclasticus]SHF18066.1 germination protein, Ger(x)C family [Caloramator proteoclasticus DSM 10124]